eukprot:Platyproteum_vivax@DN4192_c0_g1_i1.p1
MHFLSTAKNQVLVLPNYKGKDANLDEQVTQVLKNIAAILEEAGVTMREIVKTTVLLKDMNDFPAMNQIYGNHFEIDPPARTCYQVATLPFGALVEIEAIALDKKIHQN